MLLHALLYVIMKVHIQSYKVHPSIDSHPFPQAAATTECSRLKTWVRMKKTGFLNAEIKPGII